MIISAELERKSVLDPSAEDEALIVELEQKARITAIEKQGQIPSLTEVLYHMSEDDMLSIKDILGDATE